MESRDSIGFSVHTVTWVSWDAGSTYQRVEQGVSLVNDVRAVAGYRRMNDGVAGGKDVVHVHVTPRWTPIEARRAQRVGGEGMAWADRDVQIPGRRGTVFVSS